MRSPCPDRPFEGIGTDRFRLRDGLVAESLIMSDLAAFAVLARLVGRSGRLGAAWHHLGSFASGSQNLRPQCGHRMGGVR